MLNEHVVATSILSYDSHNVTQSSGSLSFRVEADLDPCEHVFAVGAFEHIAGVYDVNPPSDLGGAGGGGPALQFLGTVAMPVGRLLAYPNVLQHRFEPSELLDKSKPGHRRFLVKHLVDPHYRICSTRNVPPQQHHWWAEAGFDKIDWGSHSLPLEIIHQIKRMIGDWPMGIYEASRLRKELLQEKNKFTRLVQDSVERYQFDWGYGGHGVSQQTWRDPPDLFPWSIFI
jgi:Protein of unknown function (DUF4246)